MNEKQIKETAAELKKAAEKLAGLFYVIRILPKYQETAGGEDYNFSDFEICLQGHKEVLRKHFSDIKTDGEYFEKFLIHEGVKIQITGT